jgi:hypothetical protein
MVRCASGYERSRTNVNDGARARVLVAVAATGLGAAALIMIALSLLRDSWGYPPVVLPPGGPPWALPPAHVSLGAATLALWIAVVAGAGGVAAGLIAVARGARPDVRWLLAVAAFVVFVLTVLPPAGSTDAFDYAAYGRILALGHSPYVMTPYHLRLVHDALARSVPATWEHVVSVYGPLATAEQWLAARLGGASAARITLWLKLWNSAAFALVALVADRALRAAPARRLRAHLLWTANPLLWWDIVASGHVDVLAAALGLCGLLLVGHRSDAAAPALYRALAAGALVGAATGIKANYALYGLALAWALRRCPGLVAAASLAALAVLLAGYAFFGPAAIRALADRRDLASAGTFYDLILSTSPSRSHLALIAAVLVAAMALLALRRLPPGLPASPAIRPALALSAAWLLFWPYQYPWYFAMIACLLVFYPATRLDWLVLAPIASSTISTPLGLPTSPPGHAVGLIHHLTVQLLTPLVMLAAAAALAGLCLTGRWKLYEMRGARARTVPLPSVDGHRVKDVENTDYRLGHWDG